MNILQINKYHYQKGGSETYYFSISHLLAQKGHEVFHFSARDKRNEKSSCETFFISSLEEKPFYKKLFSFFYNREAKQKLEQLLSTRKIDVCHVHNIYHHMTWSILPVLKKHHIKTVMTVHDFYFLCPDRVCFECKKSDGFLKGLFCLKSKASWIKRFLISLEHFFVKKTRVYEKYIDYFICPSQFLYHELIKAGFKKEKLVYIPNFMDTVLRLEKQTDTEKDAYITFLGRLTEQKGIWAFVKAMESLPFLKAQIIGDGPLYDEVSAYIHKRQLFHIELKGFIKEDALENACQNASLFVIPSLSYENMPYAVLEAYAHKKPVIVSCMGGLPEIVKEGETGYIWDAKDHGVLSVLIQKLYGHEQRREMGEKGYQWLMSHCDKNAHYNALMHLYQS